MGRTRESSDPSAQILSVTKRQDEIENSSLPQSDIFIFSTCNRERSVRTVEAAEQQRLIKS